MSSRAYGTIFTSTTPRNCEQTAVSYRFILVAQEALYATHLATSSCPADSL
ncbi:MULTISPECIES: hypothetical protein [Campylobacter]|uniref:hypothetical protein n=1 Tax=Campylobacter TaxID=194 RepID=UPI0012EACAB8|nr:MULTISPECIES: hypothetical protein [Campylobacter]